MINRLISFYYIPYNKYRLVMNYYKITEINEKVFKRMYSIG